MEKMNELERKIADKLIAKIGMTTEDGFIAAAAFGYIDSGNYHLARAFARELKFENLSVYDVVNVFLYGRDRDPIVDLFCRTTAGNTPEISDDIELLRRGYEKSRVETPEVKGVQSEQIKSAAAAS